MKIYYYLLPLTVFSLILSCGKKAERSSAEDDNIIGTAHEEITTNHSEPEIDSMMAIDGDVAMDTSAATLTPTNPSEENPNLTFSDFIERFMESEDVSMYDGQQYHWTFMNANDFKPLNILYYYSDGIVSVFVTQYMEVETEFSRTWIYDETGNQKSVCEGVVFTNPRYEVEAFKVDTLSNAPIKLQITTEGEEFKVISTDYSETRGEPAGEFKEVIIINVDDNFECMVTNES